MKHLTKILLTLCILLLTGCSTDSNSDSVNVNEMQKQVSAEVIRDAAEELAYRTSLNNITVDLLTVKCLLFSTTLLRI